MRFYFHPQADHEFDDAVRYYEDSQIGLGIEFAEEVYAAIAHAFVNIQMHGLQCRKTRVVVS